jgi:acyl-CoA thioester hydrolase
VKIQFPVTNLESPFSNLEALTMKKIIETQIRVRYAETDMSGIAYNAHYLVWFEAARGEFFWQQGRDYARDVEARGYHWPVVEAGLRYHAPAYYGDCARMGRRSKEPRAHNPL